MLKCCRALLPPALPWCLEWPIITTLAAPKQLRARRAGTLYSLQWQDLSRFESGYAVEIRPQGGAWREVARTAANAESYRSSGLKPGKRYRFRVRAAGETGFSSYSNVE